MALKFRLCISGLALATILAGCEDSVKQGARAHPPASPPLTAADRTEKFPLILGAPVAFLQTERRPAVDVLVDKIEAKYEAGRRDFQAGQPEKARQDFNAAFDLILSSGIPVDSDPRLAKLFDDVVETIHTYELKASQEANAAQEPAGEQAPIEEIADLDLPATTAPALAAKAEREMIGVPHDLPLTVNEYVLSYLTFFQTTRGRAIVGHGLERAGLYSDMIRRVLREEGLPQDLIYLAQAESSFLPRSVSRAGARGIWQFMPGRGQEYDLKRTFWIDDRSDPEKATRAAAHHLRDLYGMFGDWYLVMAAYDSGPLNVIKAIERTGYADFWELYKRNTLPKETKNYVPIILALAMVAKAPGMYGIHVTPEKPARFDIVRPGHSIDLRLVADATDSDVETLQFLNPALLRMTTPNDPAFALHLPAGTADRFRMEIAEIPTEKWTSWRRHSVTAGETLAVIAHEYRVTPAAILQANHLDGGDALDAGTRLTIPAPPPAASRVVSYRVQRGDTLAGIADRFNVTVVELRRWNHLREDSKPARGARLRIYPGGMVSAERSPAAQKSSPSESNLHASARPISGDKTVHYTVKPGETLFSIAQAYGTKVATIRRMNPFLADRPLEAGDILLIWPSR